MEAVNKIEIALADQYKKLPHLPEGGQKWLADYAWVIALVGVILSALGLIGILSTLGFALFGLVLGGAMLDNLAAGATSTAVGGIILITLLFSFALYVIETILLGMAIAPLKSYKKRGWDLILIVLLFNTALVVINSVLGLQPIALIWGLIWAGAAGYFLFEVRDRFIVKQVIVKPMNKSAKGKA